MWGRGLRANERFALLGKQGAVKVFAFFDVVAQKRTNASITRIVTGHSTCEAHSQ